VEFCTSYGGFAPSSKEIKTSDDVNIDVLKNTIPNMTEGIIIIVGTSIRPNVLAQYICFLIEASKRPKVYKLNNPYFYYRKGCAASIHK